MGSNDVTTASQLLLQGVNIVESEFVSCYIDGMSCRDQCDEFAGNEGKPSAAWWTAMGREAYPGKPWRRRLDSRSFLKKDVPDGAESAWGKAEQRCH